MERVKEGVSYVPLQPRLVADRVYWPVGVECHTSVVVVEGFEQVGEERIETGVSKREPQRGERDRERVRGQRRREARGDITTTDRMGKRKATSGHDKWTG